MPSMAIHGCGSALVTVAPGFTGTDGVTGFLDQAKDACRLYRLAVEHGALFAFIAWNSMNSPRSSCVGASTDSPH